MGLFSLSNHALSLPAPLPAHTPPKPCPSCFSNQCSPATWEQEPPYFRLNSWLRSSLTLMSWNMRASLLTYSAGMPTSLSHSTMFSSFSLSADVSRIRRLVRCVLWYLMKTSLFWTYFNTSSYKHGLVKYGDMAVRER